VQRAMNYITLSKVGDTPLLLASTSRLMAHWRKHVKPRSLVKQTVHVKARDASGIDWYLQGPSSASRSSKDSWQSDQVYTFLAEDLTTP